MKIAVAAVLALAGCASFPDDLAGARDSWRGATFDEVAKAWGPPVRSETRRDGTAGHSWVSEDYRRTKPSIGVIAGGGVVIPGANMPFRAGQAVRCDRMLEFRNGTVAGGRWLGPYDYCSTFRR